MGISLNTTAANKHSPLVKKQIRVIKEHVRAIKHSLPFTVIPQIMLIEMIYYSIFWLNSFPSKSGILTVHSPRKIITGQQLDFKKCSLLPFRAYVQTH